MYQASKYLLDPLNAPEPSEETGPGAHHNTAQPTSRFSDSTISSTSAKPAAPSATVRSPTALPNEKTGASTTTSSVRSSNNPYRQRGGGRSGYPTPPGSASPRNARFPDIDSSIQQTPQTTGASTQIPTSTGGRNSSSINGSDPGSRDGAVTGESQAQGHRRRTSSLTQRHPGDQTHRPLDMLKHDDLRANRAPHLRKKHHVGADSIDTLDDTSPTAYHHEGPYEATLLARNTDPKRAPIAAVREGNAEALRATPMERVEDSVKKHRPLDGVAVVPPGMVGPDGKVMRYQEGTDMMIEGHPEGGAYKRWPGVVSSPLLTFSPKDPSLFRVKALFVVGNREKAS